eukprot:TRINITY_DN50338_c0_g1_i1.p1 TRINITY_DN50338_c0_g1~~TRINITY_DN50338_c0_g1_i1.p1  ORF type:complete len:391 (+),score=86.20 TRINITY_DN50338_c0_g1_i1:29-1174(+)
MTDDNGTPSTGLTAVSIPVPGGGETEFSKSKTTKSGFTFGNTELPLPPSRVLGPYRRFGWGVFILALAVFVVFSAVFINNTFEQRKNPPVSIGFKDQTQFPMPKFLLFCPDLGENPGNVTFYGAGCWADASFEGLNCSNAKFQAVYSESAQLDCLKLPLDGVLVTSAPSYLSFQMIYTRKLQGFSDMWFQPEDDVSSGLYSSSGLFNSTMGISNNAQLEFELWSFLAKGKTVKMKSTISTSSNVFGPNQYAYNPVSCDFTTLDSNYFCADYSNLPSQCSDLTDPETTCVFLYAAYLEIPMMVMHTYEQIDPVGFWNIFGTLSAYWIVVGLIFGLFFGTKTQDVFMPNALARKLCSCFLPTLDGAAKQAILEEERKRRMHNV